MAHGTEHISAGHAPRRRRSDGHFAQAHPLAEVAARCCQAHLGAARRLSPGHVACGECWEQAIRDDERAVVEFELASELTPNPDYVDPIAVERACRGEGVQLTPAERQAALVRLAGSGLTPTMAAERLHISHSRAMSLARQNNVGWCAA